MKKYYLLFIFCFLNITSIYCDFINVSDCIQKVSKIVNLKSPEAMKDENTSRLIKKECEDTYYKLPDSQEWSNRFSKRYDSGAAADILAERAIKLWDRICYKHGGNFGTCNDNNGWGDQKGVGWRGGCWGGYCWAGCFGGCSCIQKQVKEWCYTGNSGFGKYTKCNKDSDCNVNWSCVGTCSI